MDTLDEPALRQRLGELAGQSTVIEQTLAGHDLRLDGHDTLLAGYGSRITTAEAGLVSQGNRLTAAEASILSQGTRLTAAEASITSQGARITAAEASILSHASRLDTHDSEIAEIKRRRVTTEAQFAAALGRAETIIIVGTITFTGQYTNTIPTRIVGEPGAKMVFATTSYFINVAASLTLQHLTIEGPGATNGYCLNIGGVSRAGTNAWLRCLHVRFQKMGNVSTMTGSNSAPLGPRTIFFDCDFDEIGGVGYTGLGAEAAIYHIWHNALSIVDFCRFTNIYGNPVYFGQSGIHGIHSLGEALFVTRNNMVGFKRNGIETFSAARAFISENYLEGGDGSFSTTPAGSGIGISCAGGLSTVRGNILKNVWGYGIEIYRNGNLVIGNTVDGIAGDNLPGDSICLSVDNCSDTLIEGNTLRNNLHFVGAHYAVKTLNSTNVRIKGGEMSNVSFGVWVEGGCENITVRDVDMVIELNPSAPSLGIIPRAFRSMSGVKHKVFNNIATVGPTLGATITPTGLQELFEFNTGTGGYYDWTGTLVGPVGARTYFGNLSSNLALL